MKVPQILSYLAIFHGAVLAANLKNVVACVTETNALQISGSYCGAGTSVQFTGSAKVTALEQCFNKAGNPVQGVPKKTTTTIDFESLPITLQETGCTPFCFQTPPLQPSLDCGPAQQARIVGGVTYTDIVLQGTNLPKDYTIHSVSGTCSANC